MPTKNLLIICVTILAALTLMAPPWQHESHAMDVTWPVAPCAKP